MGVDLKYLMNQLFLGETMDVKFTNFGLLLLFTFSLYLVPVFAEKIQEQENRYRLGSGDKIEINIFGGDNMTGVYTVNGAGFISVPLVSNIYVRSLTINELQEKLVSELKPDYLLNPQVNIQVLNYRPFYIIGEVSNPGSYPYVDGMSYLNAVAIAGGFSYRAKTNYVLVIRRDDPKQKEQKITIDKGVLPGDIIRVDERLF